MPFERPIPLSRHALRFLIEAADRGEPLPIFESESDNRTLRAALRRVRRRRAAKHHDRRRQYRRAA